MNSVVLRKTVVLSLVAVLIAPGQADVSAFARTNSFRELQGMHTLAVPLKSGDILGQTHADKEKISAFMYEILCSISSSRSGLSGSVDLGQVLKHANEKVLEIFSIPGMQVFLYEAAENPAEGYYVVKVKIVSHEDDRKRTYYVRFPKNIANIECLPVEVFTQNEFAAQENIPKAEILSHHELVKLKKTLYEGNTHEKLGAIEKLSVQRKITSVNILSEALVWFINDETVASAIIEAMQNAKNNGILKKINIEKFSVPGTVFRAVNEFFPGRDENKIKFNLAIDKPYESMVLKFDFGAGHFYAIDKFTMRLKELLLSKDPRINADVKVKEVDPGKSKGEISIKFNITMANLTDFWRALGTHDFKLNVHGYYRALTDEELIEEVEERAKTFLDGIPDKHSAECRDFAAYVYGDGTDKNPGIIGILRNKEKYGNLPAIKVESYDTSDEDTGQSRSANRCTLNKQIQLAEYNPHFQHYSLMTDAQRWVYLARAAGSIFTTSYIKSLLHDYPEGDEFMYFLSSDTLGFPMTRMIRETIMEFTGDKEHKDPTDGEDVSGAVPNFMALKLAMFNWLGRIYYSGEKVNVGGRTGYVKYRKNDFYRTDDGKERHETIFVYDTEKGPAKVIAKITRVKSYVDNTVKITKAIVFEEQRGGVVKEKILNSEEMDDICYFDTMGKSKGLSESPYMQFVYGMNAVFDQAMSSGILDNLPRKDPKGVPIVPKICLVDELAIGSYDFLMSFLLEDRTRIDMDDIDVAALDRHLTEKLGSRSLTTRDVDFYSPKAGEIELLNAVYEETKRFRQKGNSVDTDIFIGYPRTFGARQMAGYPTVKVEKLMADFGMTREEAERAVLAISELADKMPHPFMVDVERANGHPIFGDIPIKLESRDVQLSASLVGSAFMVAPPGMGVSLPKRKPPLTSHVMHSLPAFSGLA
ncbi:MAG: hypothetical protein HQL28_06690, partial [Candidatus Omnitrophica bacterium]|nr:hypothetical protein [Candidatus Omnitrophota bacterium]